jgi:transcriptional regulator with XRE-family HTH domain
MTQGERIKEIRKALGLTLDKFGERVGVKKSALSSLENGRTNLTDQLSLSICREYNVNPEYLTGESDQMFTEMTKEDEIAAFLGDVLRDKEETFRKRFISALARLNEEDWRIMERILDKLANEKD